MAAAPICRSCTQPITTHGANGCPGFLRPATSAAPPPGTLPPPVPVPTTFYSFPAGPLDPNATFFSVPTYDDRYLRSLQRIAVALERLVDKLDEE